VLLKADNLIYILPDSNKPKPLKVVFDELPCPLDFSISCRYSKDGSDEFNFGFNCSNKNRNIDNCMLIKIIKSSNKEA
jgi:hypothetical protein